MKTSTLKNRIAKLEVSKSSKAYKILIDVLEGTNKSYCFPYGWDGNLKDVKIRPCYTSGSGRFTSNQDHTLAVYSLLTKVGLKVESGNDSPRGGLTGNYIIIKTKIER